MRICVITDNVYIYERFCELLQKEPPPDCMFDFYYTAWNKAFQEKFAGSERMKPIQMKQLSREFLDSYDMYISLHCKQLFPKELVEKHLCINVHPGFNPYNRGWYPQVFSLINHLPIGVTIHKMDEELDHGPILWQKQLEIRAEDTSKDVYERILSLEIELLAEHLGDLVSGNFFLTPMDGEGNINYKADFDFLCEIDRDKSATYGEVIDFLRAMTFAPYQNAFFYDRDGRKVYVGVTLCKEGDE